MDSTKKFVNPSPEENTNCCEQLFYCWILPLMKYGYKNDLQIKDVYNATKEDTSQSLGNELEKNWLEEVQKTRNAKKNGKKPSLKRAIFKTFYKSYILYGIFQFLQVLLINTMLPVVLAAYVHFFDETPEGPFLIRGWILAIGVVTLNFMRIIVSHRCSMGCQRIGMRIRIACCSLIYRKLLKLNQASLGRTATGQLVNLLSNDVQRFDLVSNSLNFVWIMPIQVALAFYVMYRNVGIAAIAGVASISIQAIPIQGYFSKLQGNLRQRIALRTDKRVKIIDEITSGIQVIKMYAWEIPFGKMVALARQLEMRVIRRSNYLKGISAAMMVFPERVSLYFTIITYVLLGGKLTGDVVYSIAPLTNMIQLYMAIYFPTAMSAYAEAKVSINRIENFLALEENNSKIIPQVSESNKCGEISIIAASAAWVPNSITPTLVDINLKVKPSILCCVVGDVGAGKTSLLQVILKELPLTMGQLEVNGIISYASQEPWLFVSSVRNNILFGRPFMNDRYKEVISVCALQKDLEQFPYRDRTLVEERGVSLSGGQKARINLARAVYAEADIYLFDDPLSAVDTHVGKHLFQKCMMEYLHDKTRILVTHQLQFIKQADLVVVLNNGKIQMMGTPNELTESDLGTLSNLNLQNKNEDKEEPFEIVTKDTLEISSTFGSSIVNEEPQETDELIEKGSIPTSTYWEYCRAGGSICTLIILLLLLIFAQMSANSCDLWLTYWTNSVAKLQQFNSSSTSLIPTIKNTVTGFQEYNNTNITVKNNFLQDFYFDGYHRYTDITYIYVYTGLIMICVLFTILRSLLYYNIATTASKVLHEKMFQNLIQAPMRFFDTNSSGRILNRFSKDMGAMDEILPRAFLEALQCLLVLIGILAMNCFVSPWIIIAIAFLSIAFYYIKAIFLYSGQIIKRLEGITRAPVFSYVSATMQGLPSIRASDAELMVIKEFDVLQDQHTGSWFLLVATNETFGFYLDLIGATLVTVVTFQFLFTRNENTLSGHIGLVISQTLSLTGMMQFGIRQMTEFANNMISVERILQYTKLEKEGPFETLPANKPPRDWPNAGNILFKNLFMKYGSDELPVLKGLNVEIGSGEKVGIVGRTGAGKSSIVASIFKLAQIEGSITIDGIDTSKIGLSDLRSHISIIPQEPVLFSSSVRYNLDPFEKHTDEVLWKALENVELKGVIEDLNQQVSEGGSNFSVGQRQLICLARAIVRNNKILIMDEATANVDPKTDALIQETIREVFKDCTVLTIAHRLNTIMDSDKVMVIDDGQVVEFDHPHKLLEDSSGYFTHMVEETGSEVKEQLRKIAKDDYTLKYLISNQNSEKKGMK